MGLSTIEGVPFVVEGKKDVGDGSRVNDDMEVLACTAGGHYVPVMIRRLNENENGNGKWENGIIRK